MAVRDRAAWLVYVQNTLDDSQIVIPPKKRKPNPDAEWRLQAKCIKVIRQRMRFDKDLRFIAAGAAQNRLTQQQRGFAKMVGYERGIFDIILLRRRNGLQLDFVELKKPGGRMTPEQKSWWEWLTEARIRCHKCETIEEFMKVLDV